MTKRHEPLRVLRVIARLNVGGPAKHVAWLMTGLSPARFAQTLITGQVPAFEHDLGPWLREQGVDFQVLPGLGRDVSPLKDLGCLWQVFQWMCRVRPHIVASHTSKAGFLSRAALMLYRPYARLRGWPRCRAVHTFHGHTFHGYFGPLKEKLFLGIEKFLARFATWRIVTISPRQFQEIHHTYKVGRQEQFRVVRLGIDLGPFAQPEKGRARFRQELGVAEDAFVIGAVGRVAPVKNYELYLQAAARFREREPELAARARFVLIGGGPENEMRFLGQRASELVLGRHLRLLGNRVDPENFFPGLDALMLTSNNEGTPVAILEGGACGLPVVATQVGGVPDLLGDEVEDLGQGLVRRQRGLGAPKEDAAALARGLALVMKDRELAGGLGAALKDYVHATHAKSRLVADIAALYEESGQPD